MMSPWGRREEYEPLGVRQKKKPMHAHASEHRNLECCAHMVQSYGDDVALLLGKDPSCLSAEAGVRSATLYSVFDFAADLQFVRTG